jgi:hypothetical protein
MLWSSRITRQLIDSLKSYQKPNLLVGNIVEMAMVLSGLRPVSSQAGGGHGTSRESTLAFPNNEEQSGKFSLSSGSTNAAKRSKCSDLVSCNGCAI